MKILLVAPLLIGTIQPISAKETCSFKSEYYPEVTIQVINGEYNSVGRGTINYKDKPVLNFETGISNGYGGQYFYIYKIKKDPSEKQVSIASGPVVNIIGTQTGRGTPKEYQKKGRDKIMFPRFGVGYYYSLSTNDSKTDGRFGGRTTEMNKILGAAEGFFIPSKRCERFIYYGWD